VTCLALSCRVKTLSLSQSPFNYRLEHHMSRGIDPIPLNLTPNPLGIQSQTPLGISPRTPWDLIPNPLGFQAKPPLVLLVIPCGLLIQNPLRNHVCRLGVAVSWLGYSVSVGVRSLVLLVIVPSCRLRSWRGLRGLLMCRFGLVG
jgi:hypothetical protein